MQNRIKLLVLAVTCVLGMAATATAQNFPSRPITIVVPFAVGKGGPGMGWVGAVLLAGSAAVAALFFRYAFASVWCLFAAVLSLYLCVVFRNVPPAPTPEVIRE